MATPAVLALGLSMREASAGGSIALVQRGDRITLDAVTHRLDLHLAEAELGCRRAPWKAAAAAGHPGMT